MQKRGNLNDKIMNSGTKGAALILSVMLMTLTLGTVLAITTLLIREFNLNTNLKYSTQAFYAAETGIEYFLWQYRRQGLGDQGTCACDVDCLTLPVPSDMGSCLGNGSSYNAVYDFALSAVTLCTPKPCIISIGDFNGVKRAIKINF